MCPPPFYNFRYGQYRVRRAVVKLRLIHNFAAIRWADAKTPASMRFWKGVMDNCIKYKDEWRRLPQHRRL